MKRFEHGGQIENFAKELNCEVKDIIDLSSNINFIKPEVNIDFNKLDISSYPVYDKLYEAIAKNYNISVDQLELFNGGSSAIFSLFKHLKLKHCTIYAPAYLEYKKACKNFSLELEFVNRLNNIYDEIKDNTFVIFVNPATPDGTYYDMDRLMNYWISKNATILIDESFLDFCNKDSCIHFLHSYDKLYILKSMTKFYSSASIRVGSIISNKFNIEKLRLKEPMWKISHFDSIYLQEALKDKSFKKLSRLINVKNKALLEQILKNSKYVKSIYESSGNYILVKLQKTDAPSLQNKLKAYKIMIRDCANFDFLDKSYVRIAVKSKENLEVLKKALVEIEKE